MYYRHNRAISSKRARRASGRSGGSRLMECSCCTTATSDCTCHGLLPRSISFILCSPTPHSSLLRTKLLAALSIPEVGEISYAGEVEDAKGQGFVFQMEIKSRQLQLRTTSREECDKWISVLIELRDRMEKKKEAARLAAVAAATSAAAESNQRSGTDSTSFRHSETGESPYARRTAALKRDATAVWQKAKSRKCLIL